MNKGKIRICQLWDISCDSSSVNVLGFVVVLQVFVVSVDYDRVG